MLQLLAAGADLEVVRGADVRVCSPFGYVLQAWTVLLGYTILRHTIGELACLLQVRGVPLAEGEGRRRLVDHHPSVDLPLDGGDLLLDLLFLPLELVQQPVSVAVGEELRRRRHACSVTGLAVLVADGLLRAVAGHENCGPERGALVLFGAVLVFYPSYLRAICQFVVRERCLCQLMV